MSLHFHKEKFHPSLCPSSFHVARPGRRASISGASDAVGMNTRAIGNLALGVTQTRERRADEQEKFRWWRVRRGGGKYQDDGGCVFERGRHETDFTHGEWGRRRWHQSRCRRVCAWTETRGGCTRRRRRGFGIGRLRILESGA